tara:strand:+ start:39 stop:422 length:384 start_codon:yes stop_codon:yes gene_type:complete
MRYSLRQFQIGEEDNEYGIISSYSSVLVASLDEAQGWFEVKDGIKYHVRTRSTINHGTTNEKSVTVEVAIPEQHPLFNSDLIIIICRRQASGHVGYRPGVVANILDLLADAFYNAGVPHEYESYTLK